jgi:citrate lyase subunit beta/citryl-CoA lyase
MQAAGIHEEAARLMRSFLFVPGDSTKKLEKSLGSGADALVLDLEDSVSADAKVAARSTVVEFLKQARKQSARPKLYVRVNALDTGLLDGDLDAVLEGAPDGIVLPKCGSGADATLLDAKLTAREAIAGLPDGSTKLFVLATETAASIFQLGTYRGATKRLTALAWAGEDLSAAVNAETNRGADGRYTSPYQVVRALGLFAAVAAEVVPVDTVYPNFRDLDGLRAECEEARRDGFAAKMAIHPAQVPVINAVFTPSPEAVARAKEIVAAFKKNPGAGVVALNGEMLDRPHLIKAERLLAQARAANLA